MRAFRKLVVTHRTWWSGYIAALGAVALVSLLVGFLEERFHIANISILYLLAVLATASTFGSGPAVVAALAAFLVFNWFFVDPIHTFIVANPEEWVMLLLFLITAVVTGQLAAGQRRRAHDARQREREAVVLYDIARLTSDSDLDYSLQAVAERLRQELELAAVIIEVADGGPTSARASAGESDALTLAQYSNRASKYILRVEPRAVTSDGAPGRWVRLVPPRSLPSGQAASTDRVHVVPVKGQDGQLGAIVLARRPGAPRFTMVDDRLLSAVAAQLSTAAERGRLRREATEAEILRRADELKSALLNAVSHDLRTPLASIIASAGSLRQQDVNWTEVEQREFGETIEQEARRLNRIVGNLLDLSRIEAGSLRPEKGWYDLSALMDDVLGRLRPVTARHRLAVHIAEDLPPVHLDYVEVDQVLSNLIENSVKLSEVGTEIHISARRTGGELQIEVVDSGPGIPPESLPHLFEPFYQVDGRGPKPRGTGLGLAVAKGLVEAHGGRIWAENRRDGGARLVFTLPLDICGSDTAAGGKRAS